MLSLGMGKRKNTTTGIPDAGGYGNTLAQDENRSLLSPKQMPFIGGQNGQPPIQTRKPKKKKYRTAPFVALTWELLNSKAYINLPASAAKALPLFLGKVKLPFNNPARYEIEFSFSYSEGERLGFSKSTFSSVIKNLVDYGFIDPADKGGLRSDGKSFNKYRLSSRWIKYGTSDFVIVKWISFQPRVKTITTPKSEPHKFKIRTRKPIKNPMSSETELVKGYLF